MKQNLYISSGLLIVFIGLVYLLQDSSISINDKGKDNRYLQVRQLADDNGGVETAAGEDLYAFVIQSGKISPPDKTNVQKEISLFVPSQYILLSNPLLFDLPPPVIQT